MVPKQIEEATNLFEVALELRNALQSEREIDAWTEGAKRFPNFCDRYGHPAFSKELIRSLLRRKDWVEAFNTAIGFDVAFENVGALFARAFELDGDYEAAATWWKFVLSHSPLDPEATGFFDRNRSATENYSFTRLVPRNLKQIERSFPDHVFRTIIDVGAHFGESAKTYLSCWPESNVHCFEPATDSYRELVARLGREQRVVLNKLAVSAIEGRVRFSEDGPSTMNRVVGAGVPRSECIDATTLDSYWRSIGEPLIDFMKIDVEGHELEVLRGASETLHKVMFIELEASMNLYNRYHVSFCDLQESMAGFGFMLFSVHEQVQEWSGGGYPVLRRANVTYVNTRMLEGDLSDTISH